MPKRIGLHYSQCKWVRQYHVALAGQCRQCSWAFTINSADVLALPFSSTVCVRFRMQFECILLIHTMQGSRFLHNTIIMTLKHACAGCAQTSQCVSHFAERFIGTRTNTSIATCIYIVLDRKLKMNTEMSISHRFLIEHACQVGEMCFIIAADEWVASPCTT